MDSAALERLTGTQLDVILFNETVYLLEQDLLKDIHHPLRTLLLNSLQKWAISLPEQRAGLKHSGRRVLLTYLLNRSMLKKTYSPLSKCSSAAFIMISRTESGEAQSTTTARREEMHVVSVGRKTETCRCTNCESCQNKTCSTLQTAIELQAHTIPLAEAINVLRGTHRCSALTDRKRRQVVAWTR